jgi:hypothetical protein
MLHYTAHASVGGKMAQIGSRLVDMAAQKMATEFFESFNTQAAAALCRHGTGGRSRVRARAVQPAARLAAATVRHRTHMKARGVHLQYTFEAQDQRGATLHNPLFDLLSAVREHGSIQHAARAWAVRIATSGARSSDGKR